jgi:hypothetical protein
VTLRAKAIGSVARAVQCDLGDYLSEPPERADYDDAQRILTALFSDPDVLEGMRETVRAALADMGPQPWSVLTEATVAALVAAFIEEGEAR